MFSVSRKNLRTASALVIPACVAFFAALCWPAHENVPALDPFLRPIQSLEWMGYDAFFNFRGPAPNIIDDRIIVVGYDYDTVGALDKSGPTPWPPPRRFHARVLDNLIKDGASVVCFDVLMDNASSHGAGDDRALDAALSRAGSRAVMACRVNRSDTENRKSLVSPFHDDKTGIDFEKAAATAFVDVVPDSDDIMRRILPLQRFQSEWIPSLAAAAYLHLMGEAVETSGITRDKIVVGKTGDVPRTGPTIRDPTDKENTMATAYMDFPAGLTTFPIRRYEQVYDGTFPPGTFKNKAVFIGVTGVELTRSQNDYFRTAYSRYCPESVGGQTTRDVYGVVVQAQMCNALLRGTFISHARRWQTALLVFTFSLMGLWGVRSFLNYRGPALLIGSVVGYILLSFWLFSQTRLYVPYVLPGILMAGSSAGVAWLERGALKKKWAGTVSPAYLEAMMREGIEDKPRRFVATVVFGDIRGFTSFSEKHTPEEVVGLLDKHLGKMVTIVFKEGGTVDKFLGDGVMIVFGAPVPMERAAYRAVKASWEMCQAALIPVVGDDGVPHTLATGFGVTTGPFVAGHVGSKDLSTYTLIGDTVNLSARLQAVTGQPDVIIDQATYDAVQPHVDVEFLGEKVLKGKTEPVACYKVTAWRN